MMGRGLGYRAVGWDSSRGAASSATNASARAGTQRDQPPRPRCPATRAVNSNSPDECPATGRISSQPLNGRPAAGGAASNSNRRTGPGTESCVKSAWSGPRCLRRATSDPQRQHSLLGTFGRANHPYGQPGQQGIVPPEFLWLETLEKPDNTVIITGAGAGKDPLRHPPGDFPQTANKKVHVRPVHLRQRSKVRHLLTPSRNCLLTIFRRVSSRAFRRQPV